MPKPTTPVRLVFTLEEAEALLDLARWAKRQTYYQLTERGLQTGPGATLRLAVNKLGVATCEPNWERE